MTVAALYVETDGVYFGLPDVDPWDAERDARLYVGPHPVVAHPPCARWGRYWSGGPSARERRKLGDDDGCFAAALASVRQFGGLLEHPEASHAWRRFGILPPLRGGGWSDAADGIGWTCCVEQGRYGHLARKATWLYAAHVELPSLLWGPAEGRRRRMEDGFHSAEERRQKINTARCQRLNARQRAATPEAFRDLLLMIARTSRVAVAEQAA